MKNIYKYSLIILSLIILCIIIYSIWSTYIRKSGLNILFNVKSGESTTEIGQNLKNKNIISSPLFFSLYVYLNHDLLQNGVYKITSNMTMSKIVNLMKEGEVQENLITIPEGWRLTQIDELLTSKKIIKQGELIKIASSSEGELYPDTYRFELNIAANNILEIMLKNYEDKTSNLKITPKDLIIASIVEREAKFDEDRAKIAGVYLTRLDQGMKLEADPTIQYAKGSWAPITVADYKDTISPYNTYLNVGLPPGPICNPGLESIKATINPIKDGSLYFYTDKNGHAVFSKTLEEHKGKLNN